MSIDEYTGYSAMSCASLDQILLRTLCGGARELRSCVLPGGAWGEGRGGALLLGAGARASTLLAQERRAVGGGKCSETGKEGSLYKWGPRS